MSNHIYTYSCKKISKLAFTFFQIVEISVIFYPFEVVGCGGETQLQATQLQAGKNCNIYNF